MDEEQKQKILEEYASNNMAKLRKIRICKWLRAQLGTRI